jgi:2-hydroxychromene-2-carboxylate isomerase
MSSITDQEQPSEIEFFFDIMCPYAYQTSRWIRDVQAQVGFAIKWRFFSLEEVNREEGKPHPWEREFAYGWTPMRVAAWLRRQDNDWCGRFYEVCGRALHVEGRRHYDREVALELLAAAGLPTEAWDAALADPTTSDEVRADHEHAVTALAGFGVPIITVPGGRAVFGPVVLPAPEAEKARELWDITLAYARFPGLFEIKTPKTDADMAMIGQIFSPYINARQWRTIQNPAR